VFDFSILKVPNDDFCYLSWEGMLSTCNELSVSGYFDGYVDEYVHDTLWLCPLKKVWVLERMCLTMMVEPRG